MKLCIIVGARPNFMKVARLCSLLREEEHIGFRLVHTNQHYDPELSSVFFSHFGIKPDRFLPAFRVHPAKRLGLLVSWLSDDFAAYKPDYVLVVGDVDSTLAGALAANKLGIPLIHLEAGLRSFDRSMPEEINRIVVDEIASVHLTTDAYSHARLASERKFFVGNTMIDCLVHFRDFIENCNVEKYGAIVREPYVLMTMHRPGNVDNPERWRMIQQLISDILPAYRIIFSTHPRTAEIMRRQGSFSGEPGSLLVTGPLGYFEFQKLISGALAVVTDSGGLQEETAWYGIPCFTLRENTERPVTISDGTNYLLTEKAVSQVNIASLIGKSIASKRQVNIPLWDGRASERIVEVLRSL